MKYCHKCGAELPDDASFCVRCGAPQASPPEATAPVPAPVAEEEWETCEIVAEAAGEKWSPIFPGEYIRFKAQAGGPAGEQTVKESGRIKAGLGDYYQPNKQNKSHAKAVADLTAALAADGWERAGRGKTWFSLRFRRQPGAGRTGE